MTLPQVKQVVIPTVRNVLNAGIIKVLPIAVVAFSELYFFLCELDHYAYSSVKCDKNIIPEFDPSVKNQRIDTWLSKVNECAHIYGWSDQQTTHFHHHWSC